MLDMKDSFVYVIGSVDGPQKIGVANDTDSRRQVLQVGSLVNLDISFRSPFPRVTAFAIERHAHWILRERRVRGEWFSVTPHEAVTAVLSAQDAVASGEGYNRKQPSGNKVGRKKTNFEQMPARFPDGTFERIDAVLEPDENRTEFLRHAVDREIKRREKAKKSAAE